MNQEAFGKLENNRLSRRSFLKGMGAAAGAAAISSSFGFSVMGQEKIKIGDLCALTGPLGPYGPPIRDGAQLAINQVKEAGGLLGKDVELVVKDTNTSPDVGRDAASKLINIEGVPAIIGALSSGVTKAAAAVCVANEIPLVSPASTSPEITNYDDNDYLFRTVVSDRVQGTIFGELALNLGYKSLSQVYVNNSYGKGLSSVIHDWFEAGGGKVFADIPYEEKKPSYRSEVEKALAKDPEVLHVLGYPVDGNKIIMHAIEMGFEGKFMLTDGMKGEGVAPGIACNPDDPDKQYIEGSFGTAPGASRTYGKKDFDKAFEAAFGATTIPYNTNAYDAAAAICLAIAAAGEATGPAIKANLRKVTSPPGERIIYNEFEKAFDLIDQGKEINYEGVSGPVTWDAYGDVMCPIEIWIIRGCEVKSLWFVPPSTYELLTAGGE